MHINVFFCPFLCHLHAHIYANITFFHKMKSSICTCYTKCSAAASPKDYKQIMSLSKIILFVPVKHILFNVMLKYFHYTGSQHLRCLRLRSPETSKAKYNHFHECYLTQCPARQLQLKHVIWTYCIIPIHCHGWWLMHYYMNPSRLRFHSVRRTWLGSEHLWKIISPELKGSREV